MNRDGTVPTPNPHTRWDTVSLYCVIESVDSSVPIFMKILKNSRWFRRRRAVGFDRAGGAIESNCPSTSKSSRIFQNFHENRDGTVRTLDGTQYSSYFKPLRRMPLALKAYGKLPLTYTAKGKAVYGLPYGVEIFQLRISPLRLCLTAAFFSRFARRSYSALWSRRGGRTKGKNFAAKAEVWTRLYSASFDNVDHDCWLDVQTAKPSANSSLKPFGWQSQLTSRFSTWVSKEGGCLKLKG